MKTLISWILMLASTTQLAFGDTVLTYEARFDEPSGVSKTVVSIADHALRIDYESRFNFKEPGYEELQESVGFNVYDRDSDSMAIKFNDGCILYDRDTPGHMRDMMEDRRRQMEESFQEMEERYRQMEQDGHISSEQIAEMRESMRASQKALEQQQLEKTLVEPIDGEKTFEGIPIRGFLRTGHGREEEIWVAKGSNLGLSDAQSAVYRNMSELSNLVSKAISGGSGAKTSGGLELFQLIGESEDDVDTASLIPDIPVLSESNGSGSFGSESKLTSWKEADQPADFYKFPQGCEDFGTFYRKQLSGYQP